MQVRIQEVFIHIQARIREVFIHIQASTQGLIMYNFKKLHEKLIFIIQCITYDYFQRSIHYYAVMKKKIIN